MTPREDDAASVMSEDSHDSRESQESRATSLGERRPGDDAIEDQARRGKPSFNPVFFPSDGQESPNTAYPLRGGPLLAVDDSGVPVRPLRFAFAPQYERMYGELAAMFAGPEEVRAHFRRIGEGRVKFLSRMLGDPQDGKGKGKAEAEAEAPATDVTAVPQSPDDVDFAGFDFEFGGVDLADVGVASNADGGPSTPLSDTDGYFPGDIFGDEPTPLEDLDGATSFGKDGAGTADTATTPGNPNGTAGRVHEIADAITRSRRENDTHHLIDPRTDRAEADELQNAIGRFPRDDRFFTLASHVVGIDGAPTWRGRPVSPRNSPPYCPASPRPGCGTPPSRCSSRPVTSAVVSTGRTPPKPCANCARCAPTCR